MRNKIPCSAERFSLLDPPMIQAVVDRNAFHIGSQYLSEDRVRIVEADDTQISSAVIGNSGLYEQAIRLKDGTSHLKVQLCIAGRADVSSLHCGPVGISPLGTAEKWPAEEDETVRSSRAGTGFSKLRQHGCARSCLRPI